MIIVMIPARIGSTRLINKLLLADTGKPLLWYTIRRALESTLAACVLVVTDSQVIVDVVHNFGLPRVFAIQTPVAQSGTDRIAKFCLSHFMDSDHIIVNLQGDEPELPGHYIDQVAELINFYDVVTLAAPATAEEMADPNIVKVVTNHRQVALYFSRSPIPANGLGLKHVGLYAYRVSFLRRLQQFFPTTLACERLEQLQWLQAGCQIKVIVDDIKTAGIDTFADYAKFVQRQRLLIEAG